ncbi:lantibiotic dehydratase [Fibrella forsythiae]|uniref:Lantibiotic dehydratase n=1 Tax=Fibrella forsythiae TaxID=2817061 RepID=A0ABS3JFN7_9BACT|nr:lantibiotic dehydratase [Fibrella forsythiae]MBO0948816.1 lantibiotic dehydratase [Fibrella forsythiae]
MIQLYDFFVLRRPAYSVSRLVQFYEQLSTQSLDTSLRHFYQDTLAQEALLAASPVLYERFSHWLLGQILPEQKKLLTTLHKYAIRMCSRPTPYGLFAGCSTGEYAAQSNLRAASLATLRTYTRVDIDCLQAICNWLTALPAIRSQLRLYPNSSLYPVGASLRYVEQQSASGKRHYFISAVEVDTYLTQLLEAAQHGATIAELTNLLTDVPIDEATDFVEQLIDSQLLKFDIDPAITGPNYLNQLIGRLAELPTATTETEALRDLLSRLNQSNRLLAYTQTRQWFREQGIEPPTADVVQVDSYFDATKLAISTKAMQYLQRDLEKLLVLNQPAQSPDLDSFKRRFYTRYEEEEIALSLALDSEFGIGYGQASTQGVGYAPLIDDLTFQAKTAPTAPTSTTWDWWQSLVIDKYADALRTQQTEIVLTDDDLTYIGRQQTRTAPLPASFYAFGSLLARSDKAIDEGDFQFNLLACNGSSAMNLLSRFGEGDAELASRIRASAAAEEALQPNVIIAEIVHLPESRVGNVLARPRIHQFEIPYLGQSSVAIENQIMLADLMVSVRNNQVVLRSKRLNKRIIPRLTTAHNFSQGLPIYRFLCDLQAQDAQLTVAWNWGVLRDQTYLPRVRYRRVIVSRATWQLQCHTLTPDNPLKLVAQLTAAGLPEQFMIAQADNELLISMHVPESLDLLIQEIRKNAQVRLVEFLYEPEKCPLTAGRESYVHELIIPFYNTSTPPLADLSQPPIQLPQRRFSVGSEWFYLKIYLGEKASDTLLVQAVYPAVQQLIHMQIVQAFFFVRYQDTDPHLRLRFRGNPHVEFYQYVVRAMQQALQQAVMSGVVHRVQVDTYQRELERYGIDYIDQCETLFYYDSLSTLTFLTQCDGLFDEDTRFAVGVAKIDRLLTGLGLSLPQQRQLMTGLKEQFFVEFGGKLPLRQQLNEKYRSYLPVIEQALTREFMPGSAMWQWDDLQVTVLRQLAQAITEPVQLLQLAGSLIHMTINRLFPSKQRVYELVLYHCLAKQYDSVLARRKAM